MQQWVKENENFSNLVNPLVHSVQYIGRLNKILIISILEGILKNVQWALRLWVGRRKELILKLCHEKLHEKRFLAVMGWTTSKELLISFATDVLKSHKKCRIFEVIIVSIHSLCMSLIEYTMLYIDMTIMKCPQRINL